LGVPFKYFGASPDGFDCIGFIVYCYKQSLGIDLSTYGSQLVKGGKYVPKDNLKLGDLVFINSRDVGIYIGNNKIIHGGFTANDVTEISEINTYYTVRRYLD